MNERTKTGLEILQAAVLLGITWDLLLRTHPWGLNIFLWIALLVAAMTAITFRRKSLSWTPQTILLHGGLIFFALMFVWRDSEELRALDFLAILSILVVLVVPRFKILLQSSGIIHYVAAGFWSGLSLIIGPFILFFDDIKWKKFSGNGWARHLIPVIRGLAIAAPIILVFGVLFMAADAVFQGLVERTFNVEPGEFVIHALVIGVIAWIMAGYLRASMIDFQTVPEALLESARESDYKKQVPSVTAHVSEDPAGSDKSVEPEKNKSKVFNTEEGSGGEKKNEGEKRTGKKWDFGNFDNTILPRFFTLGAIETGIILGLMDLLFLTFVIIQLPYLFGGMDLVQTTPDFKLAEYARRGFGELVLVAALVLPILLLSHWLLRKDKPVNEKIYRVLAGIQIILLFVIMISATQRLFLLTGNLGYGLTTIRFYPMMFMIWLALVFIWFSMTVMRGMRQQFAWGTLWLALFVLGTLHVLNPDDFIVRTNIALKQQGRSFDARYNSGLSADAVPAILSSVNSMSPEQQCTIKWNLSNQLDRAKKENDFRSWNYSRWRAKTILLENSQAINTEGCRKPTRAMSIEH